MKPINLRIAEELGVREQVSAAISLLDGGATVPFVGRGPPGAWFHCARPPAKPIHLSLTAL